MIFDDLDLNTTTEVDFKNKPLNHHHQRVKSEQQHHKVKDINLKVGSNSHNEYPNL